MVPLLAMACSDPPTQTGPNVLSGRPPTAVTVLRPVPNPVPPSADTTIPWLGPIPQGPAELTTWPTTPVIVPTPVAPVLWPFVRRFDDRAELILFEPVSRTWQVPPNYQPPEPRFATASDGVILAGGDLPALTLYDPVSEAILPLVTAIDALTDERASLSAAAMVIAYTAGKPAARRVQLLDRQTGAINPLGRFNMGRPTFHPALDASGRWLAVATGDADTPDLALYDVLMGLVDPLPAVNTPAGEFAPALDGSGRFLVYLSDQPGQVVVRLYDRQLGGIDALTPLNGLGPMTAAALSRDGRLILAAYEQGDRRHVAVYDRQTGFIDPLPEINQPGADVYF